MENITVSATPNYIDYKSQTKKEIANTNAGENKNNKKALTLALGGLAIIGIGTAAILYKNKNISLSKIKQTGVFKGSFTNFKGKNLGKKISGNINQGKSILQSQEKKISSTAGSGEIIKDVINKGQIQAAKSSSVTEALQTDKNISDKAQALFKLSSENPISATKETTKVQEILSETPPAIKKGNFEIKNEALNRLNSEKNVALAQQAKDCEIVTATTQTPLEKITKENPVETLTKKHKNSVTTPKIDSNGNVTSYVTTTKKGTVTVEYLNSEGKVMRRETSYPSTNTSGMPDLEVKTTYYNNSKIVQNDGLEGSGYKLYSLENGKMEPVYRECELPNGRKTVEQFKNFSRTTIITEEERDVITEDILCRDKKGNIISHVVNVKKPAEIELYDRWYMDYVKLCEKYNVPVRPCGAPGGAVDHFYELTLREQGGEVYGKYVRTQMQRAQYDPKARLMFEIRQLEKYENNLNNFLNSTQDKEIAQLYSSLPIKTQLDLQYEKIYHSNEEFDKILSSMIKEYKEALATENNQLTSETGKRIFKNGVKSIKPEVPKVIEEAEDDLILLANTEEFVDDFEEEVIREMFV